MTKIKPVEVNVNFLYPLKTSEKHRFLIFSEGINGNTTILIRAAQFEVFSLKP